MYSKERNYRYWNARECGWTNHQRRIINTVLGSNIRDTEMLFNIDVTTGVPHHHMLADPMVFAELRVFAELSVDGLLREKLQFRMVRVFTSFDCTKWCLNKSALNAAGPMEVYDDSFGLGQENLRSKPQWAGDTELHE